MLNENIVKGDFDFLLTGIQCVVAQRVSDEFWISIMSL